MLFVIGCTEPEKKCETASDCEGLPAPIKCPGTWSCQEGKCVYECLEEPDECETASDCEGLPTAYQCIGEWACVEDKCEWQCEPTECGLDLDCEDKECPEGFECTEKIVKKCFKGACGCICEETSALKEFHEWGVILGCTTNETAFATSRPEKPEEPYPFAVDKPVIYLHADDNTTVNVQVDFTSGKPTLTYPEAEVQENTVIWKNVLIKDSCIEPAVDGVGADILVPLESIMDELNDVDADCLTYEGIQNNFLFYEGEMKLENNIEISANEENATIKNNRDKPIHNARYVVGAYPTGSSVGFSVRVYLADFETVEPGEEKTVRLNDLSLIKWTTPKTDLERIGFTEKEASAFDNIWYDSFFQPSSNPFKQLIYRLDQSEYDEMFPLTVEPTPEKTVRAMYVLLEID